jgi:hypothetical protein
VETGLNVNPNTASGASVAYPEAYLPILVQVFTVPINQLAYGSVAAANPNLPNLLTESNRIFTYTTAKLR